MKPAVALLDPRIRRTRQMIFQTLSQLLVEKSFENITMQDIADHSTVNRGTIYAHYQDKFALLEAMVEEKFSALFSARMAGANATCREGLRHLILAVCDILGELIPLNETNRRPFEPIVESTVRRIVRDFLLEGLRHNQNVRNCAEAKLRATAGSWAICGTVLEWSRERTTTADELVEAVLPLVSNGLLPEPVRE